MRTVILMTIPSSLMTLTSNDGDDGGGGGKLTLTAAGSLSLWLFDRSSAISTTFLLGRLAKPLNIHDGRVAHKEAVQHEPPIMPIQPEFPE